MYRARRDRLLDRYVSKVKPTEIQPWIAKLVEKQGNGMFKVTVNGRSTTRDAVPYNDLAMAGGGVVEGAEVTLLASESGQDMPVILGLSSWSIHQ